MTEELSVACQQGRCQDCPERDNWDDAHMGYCMCHCHIDVPELDRDE